MDHPLTEAERQVLIAHIELCEPIETPNNTHYTFYPATLDDAARYFGALKEDWSAAYSQLPARGLLERKAESYGLTRTGAAMARQERLDHPPIWYWYRQYYTMTARSQVYSRFCAELYGMDLCQTDFSDMAQINFLIQAAELRPGDRVLDLGCGKGLFAEYLSDQTGATVWGVDYIPEAIQQALERTANRRDRLDFAVGNFDHLNYPAGSFDLLTSVDTLYMPNNLPATLTRLRDMLSADGKMLIFYSDQCADADSTTLARALRDTGMDYTAWDFSEPTFYLLRRKRVIAEAMRAEFEQEGTLFLHQHVMNESDGGTEPFHPDGGHMRRFLYRVTRKSAGSPFPENLDR